MTERSCLVTVTVAWFTDGHLDTKLSLNSEDENVAAALQFVLNEVWRRQAEAAPVLDEGTP